MKKLLIMGFFFTDKILDKMDKMQCLRSFFDKICFLSIDHAVRFAKEKL